jgi:hypothetical protein
VPLAKRAINPQIRPLLYVLCFANRYSMATYAAFFLVFYVILFPIFIFVKLWGYRTQETELKMLPRGLLLGFLVEDYKLGLVSASAASPVGRHF